jgi:hypothetical protein
MKKLLFVALLTMAVSGKAMEGEEKKGAGETPKTGTAIVQIVLVKEGTNLPSNFMTDFTRLMQDPNFFSTLNAQNKDAQSKMDKDKKSDD